MLLVSNVSLNRAVTQNQEKARTLLNSLRIDYFEIDGSDPKNKKIRNELFEISGQPVLYPQFFLVEHVRETKFLGDFDEVEAINDASSLSTEVLEANPSLLTWERVLSEGDSEVVLLESSTPGNVKTIQCQKRAQMLLSSRGIPYYTIDGANPINKANRDVLFDISGIRAKYPQFFVSRNATRTTILGDWETVEAITDATNLPEEFLEANPSIMTWDKVLAT